MRQVGLAQDTVGGWVTGQSPRPRRQGHFAQELLLKAHIHRPLKFVGMSIASSVGVVSHCSTALRLRLRIETVN